MSREIGGLDRRKLELDALLEATEAINANLPETSLYKILYFSCISAYRIEKLVLYVHEGENWSREAGRLKVESYENSSPGAALLACVSFTRLGDVAPEIQAQGFEWVVPVLHRKKVLAHLLLGPMIEVSEDQHADALSFVQTFANIIMVAIENKRMGRRALEQEALRKEVEIAQRVQELLLPKALPDGQGFDMYATYQPHLQMGGDTYDAIEVEGGDRVFCVADVSGKGVPAAMLMANFQAGLRLLARHGFDLETICRELNRLIYENIRGELYVTVFLGRYRASTGSLEYVSAGHNPVYLVRPGGEIDELTEGCLMLGAFSELPFMDVGKREVGAGDLLFAYTDGLTETFNTLHEEFGETRLQLLLRELYWQPLPELHREILERVASFQGEAPGFDDLTMLSIRFATT